MNVLLIEDEQHKANDLKRRLLHCGISEKRLCTVSSVRDAVLTVLGSKFDLIVLDMALPTFSGGKDGSGAGGVAQALGGVEVLRALAMGTETAKVIVVTQYPEIVIDGERVRLTSVGKTIQKRYGQEVLGAVLYSYNTPEWEAVFDRLVERAK